MIDLMSPAAGAGLLAAAGGLIMSIGHLVRRTYNASGWDDREMVLAQMRGRLRREFLARATKSLDRNGSPRASAAMLFLDLDNFKQLNIRHDHATGDRLLVAAAQRLRDIISRNGVIGQLGGDEFACLIPNLPCDRAIAVREATGLCEEIRDRLGGLFHIDGKNLEVTSSIGIHVVNKETIDPGHMLKCAEMAMYAAKSEGKNHIRLFEDRMLRAAEEKAVLIAELREAIDDAELELRFQPQVDQAGRITGAEALARWNHPERGTISPGVFIPVAEESGLIDALTDWVMEQALDTLVRWQRHPQLRNLSLSVNVSAPQIHHEELLERVQYYARHYDIDMSRLIIEITERVFFGDLETVHTVMMGLRDIGIRFSLDDYGTGYSSLSQLRHLHFDELKIDGTFIQDLAHNDNDKAILRSTLAMAKALDLRCVAECVETEEQRQFLCTEGCDYLQGFLFGRAVPLEEYEFSVFRQNSESAATGPDGLAPVA